MSKKLRLLGKRPLAQELRLYSFIIREEGKVPLDIPEHLELAYGKSVDEALEDVRESYAPLSMGIPMEVKLLGAFPAEDMIAPIVEDMYTYRVNLQMDALKRLHSPRPVAGARGLLNGLQTAQDSFALSLNDKDRGRLKRIINKMKRTADMTDQIIDTQEKYDGFMGLLLSAPDIDMIGVDTETEAFEDEVVMPWKLELEGVGIYSPVASGYILPQFLDEKFQALLDMKPIIAHNLKFDYLVLEAAGFHVGKKFPGEDTMVMAWLCNENRVSFKLKDLAKSILKVGSVTLFSDLKEKPERGTEEYTAWVAAMGHYCIKDCEYAYRLFKVFEKKMKTDGLWKLYSEVERPLIPEVADAEKTGVVVNTPYLETLKIKAEGRLEILKKDVLDTIKADMPDMKDDFNPGSTQQLSKYLFGHKKYITPADFVTPGGKPSTNEEALQYIVTHYKCPVTTKLLKYRELNKIYGTFIVGLLDKVRDGVVHCKFSQIGTKTGRFSSSKPNLQQVPALAEVSDCCESDYKTDGGHENCQKCGNICTPVSNPFDIRKAFVARPGMVFVDADYSQMELRIGAFLSGSKLMVDTFKAGGDLHKTTADAVGCSRKTAKMVNFSIFYGIGPYGLSRRLGISEDEAGAIIDGFFKKFPEVRRYLDESSAMLRKNYYVTTEMGRRRRFPEYVAAKQNMDFGAVGRCERMAGNARIQGLNADFTKVAMVSAFEALKPLGGHILLTVHDQLIAEVPKEKAEEAAKILKHCMETAGSLGPIPVIAEPSITTYWKKG